ncbi:MAG: Crp/Fnr family transcriptional regulator [Gemmatimonadota bacterium]
MLEPARISSLPIFSAVRPAALATLARHCSERAFGANEVVFLAGAPARHLFIVTDGLVRVVRGSGRGQFLIHTEKAGGALGEVPLFAGGEYPATAIAGEPTRCVQVGMEALRSAVEMDPELAFLFLRRLAGRVRELVGQLDRLGGQGIDARVARLILDQSAQRKQGEAFLLGRTQSTVAEDLGTVREVLVRALRQMRACGAIEAVGRGYYRVGDLARLRELANA